MDVDPLRGRRQAEAPTAAPAPKRSTAGRASAAGLKAGFLLGSSGRHRSPPAPRPVPSSMAVSSSSDTDSAEYGAILDSRGYRRLAAAARGPPDPPGPHHDPVETLAHQALWGLRARRPVCSWQAGRDIVLTYLRADLQHWRDLAVETCRSTALPAVALGALAEAAMELQKAFDLQQEAGGGVVASGPCAPSQGGRQRASLSSAGGPLALVFGVGALRVWWPFLVLAMGGRCAVG